MTDNTAILAGFTMEIYGEYQGEGLHLLIHPNTDLNTRFRAWDMDSQEFINVNGWLADFQPVSVGVGQHV